MDVKVKLFCLLLLKGQEATLNHNFSFVEEENTEIWSCDQKI